MSGTISIDSLEARWNSLRNSPTNPDEISVTNIDAETEGISLAVGLDNIGRRHLLIPTTTEPEHPRQARYQGVQYKWPRPLLRGETRTSYLDFYCTRPDLNRAFSRLAEALVSEAVKPPANAAERCIAVFEQWRELFGGSGRDFGPDKTLGLLGELWTLLELSKINVNAVETWTGPLGGIHDFRHQANALEVKSTTVASGLFHSISSIDQLDAPNGGELDLVSLRFRPVPNGPISIRLLLSDLRQLGTNDQNLNERLEEIGFTGPIAEAAMDLAFEMIDCRFYRVDSIFPRITPASFTSGKLPNGVISLNYRIDLSVEPPHPITTNRHVARLRRFLCIS